MATIKGLLLIVACSVCLIAQKPAIQQSGVRNAASLISSDNPILTPQMLVAIKGENLAAATAAADGSTLPLSLAGTSVTFNGIPAPLLYVSPNLINVQVPTLPDFSQEISGGADIVVNTTAGNCDPAHVLLGSSSMGIFTQDMSGCGPGVVFNIHADGGLALTAPRTVSIPPATLGS